MVSARLIEAYTVHPGLRKSTRPYMQEASDTHHFRAYVRDISDDTPSEAAYVRLHSAWAEFYDHPRHARG